MVLERRDLVKLLARKSTLDGRWYSVGRGEARATAWRKSFDLASSPRSLKLDNKE